MSVAASCAEDASDTEFGALAGPQVMISDGPRIAWVAGEKSGDLIAAPVIARLADQRAASACGIGGPAMIAAGLQPWWTIDDLSVRGYAEVLKALPRLLVLRSRLRRRLVGEPPAVFVGVDAPDFNLALETRLRAAGIPTIHFVGPSVWAWRRERLAGIRRAVDHMLLIFPFEKAIYDRAGIPSTYVGHPLADAIDPATVDVAAERAAIGLDDRSPVVALLPGSRPSEIQYLGDTFLQAAAWLHLRRPEIRFVLPAATPALGERLRMLANALPGRPPIEILSGQSHRALAVADAVLVASGTATLEAALFLKPMVIAYRMAGSSYRIMRRMGYLPYVGLPNILCDDWVVPELLQHAATPQALGGAILAQLEDEAGRKRIVERFAGLRAELAIGCAQRASDAIDETIAATRSSRQGALRPALR